MTRVLVCGGREPVLDEELRAVGYTEDARNYPMDEDALSLFAAFNGVSVDKLPAAFKFHPNAWSRDAWRRVAKARHYGANSPNMMFTSPLMVI